MDTHFESYCIGFVQSVKKTNNQTYIIVGEDSSYRCELVEGDDIIMINGMNGQMTRDYVVSIDAENKIINTEKYEDVNLSVCCFIGKLN